MISCCFYSEVSANYQIYDYDQVLEINDFTEFQQYRDGLGVISEKSNSTLTFTPFMGEEEEDVHRSSAEAFVFLIGDYGSCSDFDLSIDLSLDYEGLFGSLMIELGTYAGRSRKMAFQFDIYDDYSYFDTNCSSKCAARDYLDDFTYDYGAEILPGDDLVFSMQRISGTASLSITESSRGVILNKIYNTVYTNEVHYLLIDFYTRNYIENYSLILSQPTIELTHSGDPIKINPFFNNLSWLLEYFLPIAFTVVVVGVVLYSVTRERRRNKRIKREDPALYNHKEPLSEDFLESVVSPEMSEQITKQVQETVGDDFIPHPMKYDGSLEDAQCIICRSKVRTGEEIFQCPFCLNIFHKDHFIKWVSTKQKCPICKKILIKQ